MMIFSPGVTLNAFIFHFLVLLLTGAAAARGAAEPVDVERSEPTFEVRRFDPKRPPTDMPPLKGNEGAVTRSNFSASTQMRVIVKDQRKTGSRCEADVVIERVEMTVGLGVTIWLPHDADRKLIAHEQAHRRISEHFYKESAKVAADLARPYIGKVLHASGTDCEAAIDAAIKQAIGELGGRYMAAIEAPASRAQEIFDEITQHGTNGVPEDEAIGQAIERAAEGSANPAR